MPTRRRYNSKPVIGPAIKKAAVGVVKSYLGATQKLANKVAPYASKLPVMPQRHRRRSK